MLPMLLSYEKGVNNHPLKTKKTRTQFTKNLKNEEPNRY